jgi:hypothetical protein
MLDLEMIGFASIMMLGVLALFLASSMVRAIIRRVESERPEDDLSARGKVYDFISFSDVCKRYIEITGDRWKIRYIYIITNLGGAAFVLSILMLIKKLD